MFWINEPSVLWTEPEWIAYDHLSLVRRLNIVARLTLVSCGALYLYSKNTKYLYLMSFILALTVLMYAKFRIETKSEWFTPREQVVKDFETEYDSEYDGPGSTNDIAFNILNPNTRAQRRQATTQPMARNRELFTDSNNSRTIFHTSPDSTSINPNHRLHTYGTQTPLPPDYLLKKNYSGGEDFARSLLSAPMNSQRHYPGPLNHV